MTEITPEMLRMFAELGGFTLVWCRNDNHHSDCYVHPDGHHASIDFRTNLQACFDVLEAFCGKRGFTFCLSSIEHDPESCGVQGPHFELAIYPHGDAADKFEDIPEACATAKQDAIILVVLKAAEGEAKS